MYKSKLIDLLKTFSKKELKKIPSFLASPFFNDDPLVEKLYEHIVPFYPKFDSAALDRRVVFEHFFPNKAFNEQQLRYLMSDLTQLIEKYMIQLQLEKNKINTSLLLLESLSERQLDKYYAQTLDKNRKNLENLKSKGIKYYKSQYDLNTHLAKHSLAQRNKTKIQFLKQWETNLDVYYIASKLENASSIENYKNVLEIDYKPSFLNNVFEMAKEEHIKSQPVVSIYRLVYSMLMYPEEDQYFEELITLIEKNRQSFTKLELTDLYGYVRNYCIRKINTGQISYENQVFEIYKSMLKDDLLLDQGKLGHWDYNNIAKMSMRVADFKFTENFINEYKKTLHEDEMQNAYNYVSAMLHFHKKNYGKTIKLLQNIECNDPYYYVVTKNLLMKTYYELEEIIPLFSHVDAFSIYIKRNRQLSQYHKIVHQNLIKYVKKMTRIKMGSKISPEKLKKEVNDIKQFADFVWLNEKLDELIAKM